MHWIALLPHEDEALSWGWHALRFTPRVARLEEAWLLEVAASERLFGGRQALKAQLLDFPAETAAAGRPVPPITEGPTCRVALALLRLHILGVCAPARVPQDLPLDTLSAARPHVALLERTGCRTWGALRALPRGPVARRFGPALLEDLDVAWGERPARHAWLQLPEVFDQRLELPALATAAPELLGVAQRLLSQLQLWLRARQRGVLALELEWTLDLRRLDGRALPSHEQLVVRTAEPVQEMAHLRRLVSEQLARARLSAPANHLRLRTLQTSAWVESNRSFLPGEEATGERLHQLVERLSARLGQDNVLVPLPQADWRPERMQCWEPAVAGAGPRRGRAAGAAKARTPAQAEQPETGSRTAPQAGSSAPGLYPPWLLAQPRALEIRGHRPWYEGPLQLLTRRQRIETGWWEEGGAVVRDYCIARSEGAGLLWVFREQRPDGGVGWFLQGLYA